MLNERALDQTDMAEATADFIVARRVRHEVCAIAEAWWKAASKPGSEQPLDKIYWALATLAEAALGLGNELECKRWLDAGRALNPPPPEWMIESTETQLAKLRALVKVAAEKGIPLQAPTATVG